MGRYGGIWGDMGEYGELGIHGVGLMCGSVTAPDPHIMSTVNVFIN